MGWAARLSTSAGPTYKIDQQQARQRVRIAYLPIPTHFGTVRTHDNTHYVIDPETGVWRKRLRVSRGKAAAKRRKRMRQVYRENVRRINA